MTSILLRKASRLFFLLAVVAFICQSGHPQGQLSTGFAPATPGERPATRVTYERGQAISQLADRLRGSVAEFASFGSRVSGYPGCDEAANLVEAEFKALGLEKVSVQEFPLTAPVDEGASVQVGDKEYTVYPLWPNLVRTPATPPDGLRGPLIYAGTSRVHEYNGKEVDKALVLMDFDCQDYWINAPSLGAQAVLFIEPDNAIRAEAEMKYFEVPIDVPRYWVPREAAQALLAAAQTGSATATVRCKMTWQNRVAKNIMGLLPGSDPKLADQCIVIQAYYDSISVVPGLSPGADEAGGMAALLEMARYFKEWRLPRPVLFVATAGHFQALSGMREFAQLFGAKGKRPKQEAQRFEDARKRKLSRISDYKGKIQYLQGLLSRPTTFETLTKEYQDNITELESEIARLENDVAIADAFGHTDDGRVLQKPIFISLDLTSQSTSFGLFFAGTYYLEVDKARFFSPFGKTLRKLMEPEMAALGLDPDKDFVDASNPVQNMVWSDYFAGDIAFDSEMAIHAGRPGITFATINDARMYVNTPHDTMARFNADNLATQVYLLETGLAKLIGVEEVSTQELIQDGVITREDASNASRLAREKTLHATALKRTDPLVLPDRIYDRRTGGRTIEFVRAQSFLPNTPVPRALVLVNGPVKCMSGVSAARIVTSDSLGDFEMTGHDDGTVAAPAPMLNAYKLDDVSGEVTYAPDMGSTGAIYSRTIVGRERSNRPIILFPGKPIALFDIVDQRFFQTLQQAFIYDATSGGEPVVYCTVLPRVGGGQMKRAMEPVALVFTDPGHPVNITFGMGIMGIRMVLLNSTVEGPRGSGFDSGLISAIPMTAYRSATDMWILDDSRIRKLTEKGITNNRVEFLHQKAKEELQKAKEALAARDYRALSAASHEALGYESSAYPDVMGTSQDVVWGVVFYLMCLLPFCYFMERLVFGYGEIGKRIGATVGIFLVIYLILREVHPAFALTMTGEVILLAFVVGALAFIVIVIIASKFNEQLEKMKQELAGVHKADVGRISAATTAFSLGVANMRRRKLRTALTSVTLILLTFTVLSFTSVRSYTKPNRLHIGKAKPVYNGVMLRDRVWGVIEKPTYDILEEEYPEAEAVVPRSWYCSADVTKKLNIVLQGERGKTAIVNAVLGLSSRERLVTGVDKALLPGGTWFERDDELSCILPQSVATQLGVGRQQVGSATVRMFGVPYRVIGIAEDKKLEAVKDMDGESVLPVDYTNLKAEVLTLIQAGSAQQTGLGKTGVQQLLAEYTHFGASQVALMSYTSTVLLGATLRSVVIQLPQDIQPKMIVQDMLDRLALSMYANEDNKVYLYSAISISSPEAPGGLAIPILIAALIVLNTMLGAVHERVREIGIFSAVGLAPVHISFLFFAEACVYAVIGAIIGYLLGQVVAQFVLHFGWLQGVNLNYSSLSAVMASVVVGATVLLSTIWPARKAAQLSVPDIERKWKLPEPEGDTMRTRMPFSLTGTDGKACSMFMVEFFDSYVGFAGGEFYTENVSLRRLEEAYGEGYEVVLKAWLAPYDLGVSQMIYLRITPTEEGNIYQIGLQVDRESGDINSWKKTNWLFLNTLRKQFLIWRTIAPEDRVDYARRAEEWMEKSKAEV
jgi:hypothetical protein